PGWCCTADSAAGWAPRPESECHLPRRDGRRGAQPRARQRMWQNCRVATVKEGERDEQAWTQAQGSPQEQREPRQATQHLSRGSPLRRSWCPWHSSCPWCARGPTVGAARSDAVRPLGHKPSHSWGGSNRVLVTRTLEVVVRPVSVRVVCTERYSTVMRSRSARGAGSA